MIDPDSFIVQRDPTTGSLKYLIPEEAMSHYGVPVYQERKRNPVTIQKRVARAMLIVWLGLMLLSGSLYWLKYRPSGVDRYGPAFTEAGRVK
jgi:hypothetical protein